MKTISYSEAFKMVQMYLSKGYELWVYDLPYDAKARVSDIHQQDFTGIGKNRRWLKLDNRTVVDFRGSLDHIRVIDYRGIPRRLFKITDDNQVGFFRYRNYNFAIEVPLSEAKPGDSLIIPGKMDHQIYEINLIVEGEGTVDREEYYEITFLNGFAADFYKVPKDATEIIFTFLNPNKHENQGTDQI